MLAGNCGERLYEWVSWLEDRYLRNLFPVSGIIPEVPADWYRHPVAVEMLTALMVSHAAAYRKKAAPPSFALVEWHERCLWPTLARMESLKLFTRGVADSDWDGPIESPTVEAMTVSARGWQRTSTHRPQRVRL